MSLFIALCLLLAAALTAWQGERVPPRARSWLLAAPAAAAFVLFALAMPSPDAAFGNPVLRVPWVPQIGLDFALRANGFGLLLAMLVTGIGALILAYATGYMHGHAQAGRLYAYLYGFMFAMAGLGVADHLLLFFIFWELTGILSYLLIGFNHDDPVSRRNALQALLVTGIGGLALLAASILVANAAGTWYLSELPAHRGVLVDHAHYPAILFLVVLAGFTKSAQFPFQFWLPNAMAAPTPVSAYLHSATMVKAGVFLFGVLLPILGGTALWTGLLTTAGAITLLGGGIFGLRQNDLKAILAGTTVAVLGLLTLLLGVGTEKAVLAALLFMVGHAFYKAALFMTAGAVDHETGTRDVRLLGGLRRAMPWTAAAAGLAGLSKMGLPPFFGFLGKEYTYKAGLATEVEWLLCAVLILGNAMILALAVKAAILPFWSARAPDAPPLPKHPHEAPWPMRAGPLILGVAGIVIGLVPALAAPWLSAAKSGLLAHPTHSEISLWHGFNLALLLSAVTVAAGLVVLLKRHTVDRALARLPVTGPEAVYDKLMAGMLRFANWQTRMLQSGYLRNYLLIILGTTCAAVVYKLWIFRGPNLLDSVTAPADLTGIAVALLMLCALFYTITTSRRLGALVGLGVIGFGVAFLFALYGAPDLAITQILVETLIVVLFAWVVNKLPSFRTLSPARHRWIDGAVAVVAGGLISVLLLESGSIDFGPGISETLAEWSLPRAHGANVVNVILVDFRALDTWGEITVLAIAALGVWGLLDRRNS